MPGSRGGRLISLAPGYEGELWLVFIEEKQTDFEVFRLSRGAFTRLHFEEPRPAITYPQFAAGANAYCLQGYNSLFTTSRDLGSPWVGPPGPAISGISGMVAGSQELAVLFQGASSLGSGCLLFREGGRSLLTGSFEEAAFGADGRTVFLADRSSIWIRPARAGELPARHPLPTPLSVQRILQALDGSLWLGSSEGLLHGVSELRPPDTHLSLISKGVEQGASLQVQVRGSAAFQPEIPAWAFHYSWRVDGAPWSAYQSAPPSSILLPKLEEGEHTLEVRARDASGNEDSSPARTVFTILPHALQEQPWFLPAILTMAALVSYLAWQDIRRRLQLARNFAALHAEVAERQGAERRLREARDELERRVTERTAELSHAYDVLLKESTAKLEAEQARHRSSSIHLSKLAALPSDLQGRQLLLVDDERMVVVSIGRYLELSGYKVHGFTNSLLALEAFQKAPDSYDLVITDRSMPELNSIDFSLKISQLRPGTKILMITAYGDDISPQQAAQNGIAQIISKPVLPSELLDAVQGVLLLK